MVKYFFSRQVAIYFVLQYQIKGQGNWKGALCVTQDNKALQHKLWSESPQKLCWRKWQVALGGGIMPPQPSTPGQGWDTSQAVNATWNATWFWSMVSSRWTLDPTEASQPSQCPWQLLLEHCRHQTPSISPSKVLCVFITTCIFSQCSWWQKT